MQREYLKPSEKAFAYKMKLEAMKHQGKKESMTDAFMKLFYFSGIHILTTVPPSSLKEKDMVPPHIKDSLSRMLPMAIWGSLLS